jgi:hypothetical protein
MYIQCGSEVVLQITNSLEIGSITHYHIVYTYEKDVNSNNLHRKCTKIMYLQNVSMKCEHVIVMSIFLYICICKL